MNVERISVGRLVAIPLIAGWTLRGPQRVTVRVRGDEADALFLGQAGPDAVDLDIALDEARSRYVVRAIRGEDLTGGILRELRIAEIIFEAVLLNLARFEGGEGEGMQLGFVPKLVEAIRGKPVSTDSLSDIGRLEAVAMLYRLAYLLGQRPTAAVVEGLGLSRSTANRILSEARERLLLRPTEERKAGV